MDFNQKIYFNFILRLHSTYLAVLNKTVKNKNKQKKNITWNYTLWLQTELHPAVIAQVICALHKQEVIGMDWLVFLKSLKHITFSIGSLFWCFGTLFGQKELYFLSRSWILEERDSPVLQVILDAELTKSWLAVGQVKQGSIPFTVLGLMQSWAVWPSV